MATLLCAAALGIVLGLCFRIIVMLPAMLVAAAGIAVLGVSSGQNIHITALNLVAAGVSLQIGYFIGAILAEYQRRQTELRRMAAWTGERPVIDEVIYRSEPDSGGERDQWVLVCDPQSGERGVRHDRVTLEAGGSSAPFVRSGPIVPLADFLGTEQPQNVKRQLLSMLAYGEDTKH